MKSGVLRSVVFVAAVLMLSITILRAQDAYWHPWRATELNGVQASEGATEVQQYRFREISGETVTFHYAIICSGGSVAEGNMSAGPSAQPSQVVGFYCPGQTNQLRLRGGH